MSRFMFDMPETDKKLGMLLVRRPMYRFVRQNKKGWKQFQATLKKTPDGSESKINRVVLFEDENGFLCIRNWGGYGQRRGAGPFV